MVKAEDFAPGCGGDEGFGSPSDGFQSGGGILASPDNIIDSSNSSMHMPASGIIHCILENSTE